MNFYHDGDNAKAKKVVPGGATTYYYSDLFEVTGAVSTKFIFAGNLRVAMITGENAYYYSKDYLDSSTLMTDEDGVEMERAG